MKEVLDYILEEKERKTHPGLPLVNELPTTTYDRRTKEMLFKYLVAHECVYAEGLLMPKQVIDLFNGKEISIRYICYHDKAYSWDWSLPYFLAFHDLALPTDFVFHVEDYFDRGGKVSPEFCVDWENQDLKFVREKDRVEWSPYIR